MSTSKPPVSRKIKSPTKLRDIIIAVSIGAGILLIVIWASLTMKWDQGKPSRNKMIGTIVAKHDSEQREQQISVGRKGLNSKAGDTGYSFEVRVDPGGRIYELPVNEGLYHSKKVGDTQEFIRPPSEQR